MKFFIAIALIAFAADLATCQKDPGQVASDCKIKFNITAAEEADIRDKKFASTTNNAKSFFDCFISGTGFVDASGNLNRTAFVATANGDQATIANIDATLKECTSKSIDKKQKVWELAACYFKKMGEKLNKKA